jgi:MFS family permease
MLKKLADKFGENKTIFIMDGLAILAFIIQLQSLSILTICISRFLLGIYCGISSGLTPVYLMSIAPTQISGIIGSFNQLFITIGIAVAYYIGYFLPTYVSFSEGAIWRIIIAYPIIFCMIRLMVLFIFP